jgi:hypothetical protein
VEKEIIGTLSIRHSERSKAQRNEVEESRGRTMQLLNGIPRLRCGPFRMIPFEIIDIQHTGSISGSGAGETG